MAVQKPLHFVSGVITEVPATETSTGAGSEGQIVALNGAGKIDPTMLEAVPAFEALASEGISAGDLINLHNVAGVINVRKADASGGVAKKADGYAPAAITSGQSGEVRLDNDVIVGLSGMTVGGAYFLSGVAPGAATLTPPSTATYIVQRVGKAKSATELAFDASCEPVVLA